MEERSNNNKNINVTGERHVTKQVVLHIGTPKTGTSYLQDVLFHNRKFLAEHRIFYPAERYDSQFFAALDLMQLQWGGLEAEAVGTWSQLAESVRAIEDGTVIISHEILAKASQQQVKEAIASLGNDSEIHLVISVRDLARQIPAEWQEKVKHRSILNYAHFLDLIRDPLRVSREGAWFWGVQDLPAILDRWGHNLPPERIHIVTVPPPGSDRNLLWKRFSHAFGLDGINLDLRGARTNPSMGAPETALLRQINLKVNSVVAPADYRPLILNLLAHRTLAARTDSPRLTLRPDLRPWVAELSRQWVCELKFRAYNVVGDLNELLASEHADGLPYVDPDRPCPHHVASAAIDVIEVLLIENARLRSIRDSLRVEADETLAVIEHAYDVLDRAYDMLGGLDELIVSGHADDSCADPDLPLHIVSTAIDIIKALLVENVRLRAVEDSLRA